MSNSKEERRRIRDEEYERESQLEAAKERAAFAEIDQCLADALEAAQVYFMHGSYAFTYLESWIHNAKAEYLKTLPPEPEKYKKKPIPKGLRIRVLERDMYRCVICGTHLDLCVDHIFPEAAGGLATLENLQAMCRPCNTRKGAKIE